MSKRAKSELLFEQACEALDLTLEQIPTEQGETPDFKLIVKATTLYVEVKQFDDNDEETKLLHEARARGSMAFFLSITDRIRRGIHDGNRQLKARTNGMSPGLLVIYANTSLNDYDSQDLHDAMFGTETYTFQRSVDPPSDGKLVDVSLARDGNLKPQRNTSTSAVVSLRALGETFVLNVYHNKFAKVPLDPAVLRLANVKHYASIDRQGMTTPDWIEV